LLTHTGFFVDSINIPELYLLVRRV